MTNEEVMTLMTDMGLHEGGMDNWLIGNAWFDFANAVQRIEREACWSILFEYAGRDDLTSEDESLLKHIADLILARGQA
jgi:hypothetical protein